MDFHPTIPTPTGEIEYYPAAKGRNAVFGDHKRGCIFNDVVFNSTYPKRTLAHKWNRRATEMRGEWIGDPECLAYDDAFSDDHIVCSRCKRVWSVLDNCTETFDFCPGCGAKMDGGDDNDRENPNP